MNDWRNLIAILKDRRFWGPLMLIGGVVVLLGAGAETSNVGLYVRLILGGLLSIVGIGLMLTFFGRDSDVDPIDPNRVSGDGSSDYVIVQLTKNHDVLRSQTTQGFMMSGVFMSLGLLAILAGYFGQVFGFASHGANLTTVAGVISEFISGTSLLLYRLNFKRLTHTSDRLDEAWRILAAHRLADQLPAEKKAEATMRLIESLASTSRSSL